MKPPIARNEQPSPRPISPVEPEESLRLLELFVSIPSRSDRDKLLASVQAFISLNKFG